MIVEGYPEIQRFTDAGWELRIRRMSQINDTCYHASVQKGRDLQTSENVAGMGVVDALRRLDVRLSGRQP
jgi:hypothetical protein